MNVPANSFDCLGESLVFLLVAGWWMFSVIPKEGQQVLKEGKRERGKVGSLRANPEWTGSGAFRVSLVGKQLQYACLAHRTGLGARVENIGWCLLDGWRNKRSEGWVGTFKKKKTMGGLQLTNDVIEVLKA